MKDVVVTASERRDQALQVEVEQLRDLLRRIAPMIRVRNANGVYMERKCVLCNRTGNERVLTPNGYFVTKARPCPHTEIFKWL